MRSTPDDQNSSVVARFQQHVLKKSCNFASGLEMKWILIYSAIKAKNDEHFDGVRRGEFSLSLCMEIGSTISSLILFCGCQNVVGLWDFANAGLEGT